MMPPYEPNPVPYHGATDNLAFFTVKPSHSKRGHNSRRDKRVRWQIKHPGRIRKEHGRP